MIFNELEAVEFQLKLKSGWQLIGLPTDIRASEAFNNDNVRLVWYYNGKTAKWEGYSPEKELKTKIEERRLDPIYFIERWQGLWVYSKVDWSLIIDETETPTTSSLDISNIKLYKGWNLISLPFDAVYSQKLFDGYKLWRYNSLNSNWQTNQKYEVLSFPEVDEVNSKDGFWVYSPEDREIDLSMVGGKLSTYKADAISETIGTFKTISEVETYIKKASLVGNREKKYWNWTEVIDDYTASNLTSSSTSSSSTSQTSNISNSIVNQTGLPSKYTGVEQANLLKEKNRIIYYKSGSQSISAIAVDDMLYSQNKTPMAFSISFAKGTSSIREFFTARNKLIVISDLNDFDSNSSFANQCRANKTAISIYDINSQPIGFSNEKHVFIDGSAVEARMIDSSLYLV